MQNFLNKVKTFSQKANELKTAMQQLPPKIVEVRESVAATTGQLQQLKSQIQYSVADLKKDDEASLGAALEEINASADIFANAGYVLRRVDVELSPVQRLVVHLARTEDVPVSTLRSLADANKQRKTTYALLSSLLQARQMADTVELTGLEYSELIVGVGPVPTVRLSWRADEEAAETPKAIQPVPAATPAVTPPAIPHSYFSQSSFFEKREAQPQQQVVAPTTVEAPSQPVITQSVPSPRVTPVETDPSAKPDPLARFKKMPNLSRI